MTTILDEIVSATHDRVSRSRSRVSLSDLRSLEPFAQQRKSLADSLTQPGFRIIAEVKRSSPSAGTIRPTNLADKIALEYQAAGAAAISVLTEPEYFSGSLYDLSAASDAVDIPVLRKDFIVDQYQVYEARAFGADAILLIVRSLEKEQIADLYALATELDLDVLVELYDANEIEKLDLDTVRIVGANNRDLQTMTVDINRSVEILGLLPEGIVKVSESGISSRDEIDALRTAGISAALVGESLMRHKDPGKKLRSLLTDHTT